MYAVCDLCGHLPEFPSVNEWNNGAKVIGGFIFVVLCGSVSGVEGYNEKPNRTGWTKNGMIKINGGSNWIHFAMVPPTPGPQQSHETSGMHHTELIS